MIKTVYDVTSAGKPDAPAMESALALEDGSAMWRVRIQGTGAAAQGDTGETAGGLAEPEAPADTSAEPAASEAR